MRLFLLLRNFWPKRNYRMDRRYIRNRNMLILWDRFCYRCIYRISDHPWIPGTDAPILVLIQKKSCQTLKNLMALFFYKNWNNVCCKWHKHGKKPLFMGFFKGVKLFPFAPENCNLNKFVWIFLHTLSGVFRLSAKYGLSRFLLSSCCHANNDIIHANCRFFNRFCKRNNLRIIK